MDQNIPYNLPLFSTRTFPSENPSIVKPAFERTRLSATYLQRQSEDNVNQGVNPEKCHRYPKKSFGYVITFY